MPVYEHQCEKCSAHFEVEQRITEDPVKRCAKPECAGEARRVIPTTNFTLKGSGWFRSGGY